jgi:hypothetical protein
MSKKMMLLAVMAGSAVMLAVPTLGSAQSAHLSSNPGAFSVHGGALTLSRVAGGGTLGTTTTGSGGYENTTTGTLKLTLHGMQFGPWGSCSSTAEGHPHTGGPGTVTTTTLPFHLITLPTESPAILITSAVGGHFASYTCGASNTPVVVSGNGIIGTIASPNCGVASNTASLRFTGAAGVQAHTSYTGTKYALESTLGGGGKSPTAINAEATITFAGGVKPSLICTHTST